MRSSIVSTQEIYRGRVISLRRNEVIEPGNVRAVREIVHHNGSAVILPRLPNGRFVLSRQFRFAADDFLWELPAGSCAQGETPLRTARRELTEETGYRSRHWKRLVAFYPSPGVMDEKMTIFLADNVIPGAANPEDDERITVRDFSLTEIFRMI